MSKPTTVTGRELYELVPTVYRVKDEDGHLSRYLDSCGVLLDRLRATLEQRLADAFPASPPEAMPAQSWLLPYFADLLDVRLVSPLVAGRRGEVARAIAWRQRKGTLATLEEIAETVGGFEAETQEGWQRVAVTPRIDRPLLPAAAYGESEPDPSDPQVARRHPALPAVTVDVTLPSRAVACDPAHPRAKLTRFRGHPVSWRQLNPHGEPCFPGSFEDASPRTPDMRTPDPHAPARGLFHPRRLLVFMPPPLGFFPFDVTTTPPPVFTEESVTVENLVFTGTLHLSAGRIKLRRVAAKKLVVDTGGVDEPVIDAVDCLFDEIEAPNGLVRLEATTVMKSLTCRRLQASDCLLAGTATVQGAQGPPGSPRSCVRYSRVPASLLALPHSRLERLALTAADPIFSVFEHCAREGGSRLNDQFGDPGYGTLHPATPDAICFGAEDGGEMGADHFRASFLARAAVLTKLEEFLPVGIEAVLVPDPRLLVEPPRIVP